MKIKLIGIALLACGSIALSQFASADDSGSLRIGDIQGSVNVCGTGGRAGVLAYIAGRSFMARTDDNGAFRLSYLPSGSYQIAFEQAGTNLGKSGWISVRAGRVTSVSAINICADQAVCPAVYDPVCGVDGKTYPNPCEAERVGVAIAHTGVCN